MRNLVKVIALAAAICFSTAAYAQQKSITIAGVPNNYKGKVAMLALAPALNSQSYTAYSLGTINGASVTFPLLDWTTDKPWNGSGNFAFVILIGENTQAIAGKQYLYSGQTSATTSVSQATTTVQWSQFLSAAQQAAPQQSAQKSITISGIPNNYKGKAAMLALAPAPGSQSYTAYSLGTISGASATFPLLDYTTDKPWSGSGNFAFTILIGETAQAIANSQLLYNGQTSATTSVSQATTTVQWSQFLSAAQQAQQPSAQKSITLKGFPNNYKGKTAMLALAPAPGSQSYIAYSLGTISGVSVTFPLSDWTTDKPWSGSGNFAFVIVIGENVEAISNNQLLYSAQTNATTDVSATDTTIQWAQFAFLKVQQAPRQHAQRPAQQQPAAPAGSAYIITGSGTAFTAARGGATVGTAGQPIQTVIDGIRTHANGAACAIQFGNGSAVLDIGTASVSFKNSGGTWGAVTLSGKITSAIATIGAGTVSIEDAVPVNSSADITNTGGSDWGRALYFYSNGTLNITGGAIRAAGISVLIGKDGAVNISGGTISSTKSNAMNITGNVTVTISGNAVISSEGGSVINYPVSNSTPTLNITGGTVEYTGPGSAWSLSAAISLWNDVTLNVSGGAVKGGGGIGILQLSEGPITISGNAVVSTTNRIAIQNGSKKGTLTISGGTVSATTGKAVHNTSIGKIIVSGTANITSANTDSTEGTIYLAKPSSPTPDNTDVRLEMTGGTVRNTGTAVSGNAIYNASTCGITVSGGTVSAPSGNAINNKGRGALNTSGAKIEGKVTP